MELGIGLYRNELLLTVLLYELETLDNEKLLMFFNIGMYFNIGVKFNIWFEYFPALYMG